MSSKFNTLVWLSVFMVVNIYRVEARVTDFSTFGNFAATKVICHTDDGSVTCDADQECYTLTYNKIADKTDITTKRGCLDIDQFCSDLEGSTNDADNENAKCIPCRTNLCNKKEGTNDCYKANDGEENDNLKTTCSIDKKLGCFILQVLKDDQTTTKQGCQETENQDCEEIIKNNKFDGIKDEDVGCKTCQDDLCNEVGENIMCYDNANSGESIDDHTKTSLSKQCVKYFNKETNKVEQSGETCESLEQDGKKIACVECKEPLCNKITDLTLCYDKDNNAAAFEDSSTMILAEECVKYFDTESKRTEQSGTKEQLCKNIEEDEKLIGCFSCNTPYCNTVANNVLCFDNKKSEDIDKSTTLSKNCVKYQIKDPKKTIQLALNDDKTCDQLEEDIKLVGCFSCKTDYCNALKDNRFCYDSNKNKGTLDDSTKTTLSEQCVKYTTKENVEKKQFASDGKSCEDIEKDGKNFGCSICKEDLCNKIKDEFLCYDTETNDKPRDTAVIPCSTKQCYKYTDKDKKTQRQGCLGANQNCNSLLENINAIQCTPCGDKELCNTAEGDVICYKSEGKDFNSEGQVCTAKNCFSLTIPADNDDKRSQQGCVTNDSTKCDKLIEAEITGDDTLKNKDIVCQDNCKEDYCNEISIKTTTATANKPTTESTTEDDGNSGSLFLPGKMILALTIIALLKAVYIIS